MQTPITILPGDKRMRFVAENMAKKGARPCASIAEIPDSGYLICGVPFTRDKKTVNITMDKPVTIDSFLGILTGSHILVGGNLPESVITHCTHHGIKYYDVMTSRNLGSQNARLTAEGLLIPLLSHTSFSIRECKALLIGYGNCGREIADILRLFTDDVYLCETNPDALKAAKAKHFKTISESEIQHSSHHTAHINTIINTAPANPFEPRTWSSFPDDCTIFNIASRPLDLPAPLSEQVIDCPGIPGKYAPKTAGNLIARDICDHFKL